MILRAAETGAGAAAPPAAASSEAAPGAGAAPAAAPAAPAGAAAPAAAPAAAAAQVVAGYRPDGLPDHFLGASDKDTIDKLYTSVKGFRDAQAQRGEVPKDAKGYVFEPIEAVKPYAGALDADPFMGKVKQLALDNGIPTKQFNGFLNGIMAEMVAGDMVAEPFSADKERAALVPSEQDPQKRAAAADRIVRENQARIAGWKEQGLGEDVVTFLTSSLDRAAANKLVQWIADRSREAAPAMTGTQPTGKATEAQLRERMADPRNDPRHPKYDRGFAGDTDKMFQATYGTGEGRG